MLPKFLRVKILFAAFAGFLLFAGIGCKGEPAAVQEAKKPFTLKYWRVFDDSDAFEKIISAYRALHPNISIEYRKLRFDEYEQELLEAFAEDRGPDIFAIHNTWVKEYEPRITSLPSQITMPFTETRGTIKKEQVTVLRTTPSLTLRALKNNFVDMVAKDVVLATRDEKGTTERIYALPLAMDTLALFYNKDLLARVGIAEPPVTWAQFQDAVKRLTKLDSQGNVLQSGAAIGTSKNVERAFDVLSLLMMQNGTQMADESGFAAFNTLPRELEGRTTPPGEEALVFYTDFANPLKEVYTWNDKFANSLDAFAQGKTAFFFGYSFHTPTIRARSPKLNFAIAKAPQIEGNREINYANYWVEAVAKKSQHQNEAWDFIQFAAAQKQVGNYLEAAKKPAALRALISGQLEDEDLGSFASQVLTADSWYRGKDAGAAERFFGEMIDDVLRGAAPREALNLAAQKVNQTVR